MACSCAPGLGYIAKSSGADAGLLREVFGAEVAVEVERLQLMSPAELRTELLPTIQALAEKAPAVYSARATAILESVHRQPQIARTMNELVGHLQADTAVLPAELVMRTQAPVVLGAEHFALPATAHPVDMVAANGTVIAGHRVVFCDACQHVFTEGEEWYGCPHDTRCHACYSSSTTRGAADASGAGAAAGASVGASSSFQSKA